MKKILLDTDIGSDIDDAICLAYLLKEPQCELLGITTVCGESEKIRAYPHEVTLIAIGSLTNIALLLTDYPDTVQLLRDLFIMNDYFGEKALSHPLENWNSWTDPLASRLVFAARPATFRCFPLEVTDTLTMEASRIRRLTETNSELIRAVLDFGSAWLRSS